jgi:uncharacterized protein
MEIAVIGGGASGMVSAYLLDKQGHRVTVFEQEPILGGHIRTLNKNVKPNQSDCNEILESGVLEFPTAFDDFIALMKELDVELEPVNVGSGMFFNNGNRFLSGVTIDHNFTGISRILEHLRLDTLYARSAGLWLRTQFIDLQDCSNLSLAKYLKHPSSRNTWLKLFVMYSYSIPLELIDDFPAELAMPMLREYISVNWVRIKGGVYSYIEKILARFKGEIVLNAKIDRIVRNLEMVQITQSTGEIQEFDRVVFATPPDQILALLADPTDAEIKRFTNWKANHIISTVHNDALMYARYGIDQPSEFDFFQTNTQWGYNGYLNQLCNISSSKHYFLSFQLEELIVPERIIHTQAHHTPLYTTAAFRYRDQVIATNGENNTYHAGAYLGDGLHEGAITSAVRVAQLIGLSLESISSVQTKREQIAT